MPPEVSAKKSAGAPCTHQFLDTLTVQTTKIKPTTRPTPCRQSQRRFKTPWSSPPETLNKRLFGPQWLSARERVAVLAGVMNRSIIIREVSADEHRALLAGLLPEPIAAQKVAMLGTAPRSLCDCPDLPLGQGRTPYSVWAAANTAAFGLGGA